MAARSTLLVGGGLGLPSYTSRPLPALSDSLAQASGLSVGSSRSSCDVRGGWSVSEDL